MMKRRRRGGVFLLTHGVDRRLSFCDMGNIAKVDYLSSFLTIAKRRNSLFGHVVRFDNHTPAHRALSQVAAARTGSRSGPGWWQPPRRPRHSWIQQIGDGTPFSIRGEWWKTGRRGHSGLTQRTSAVYAI